MKFLVDMSISPRMAAWLKDRGHDALHASSVGLERATDRELLDRAANEARIVITADTDFPHILALSGEATPGIILFRGGDYSDQETRQLLEQVLEAVSETSLAKSICVVDRRRIRVRPLPLR